MSAITVRPGPEAVVPSLPRLHTRIILLAAVFMLAFATVIPVRAGIVYIDVWGANVWWTDPGGGGGALAEVNDSFYYYTGEPYKWNQAQHWDSWCNCLQSVAAKAFITEYDMFPWYETDWDIDPYYANAVIAYSLGYWAHAKFQAYVYTGWTTYFHQSPILPN